jgi:hypothetical protein
VLDFTNRGPLILISSFQTPTAIRQLGAARLTRWLKRRGIEAANRQTAHVPGQAAAASLIVRLAQTVLDLDLQLTDLDRE